MRAYGGRSSIGRAPVCGTGGFFCGFEPRRPPILIHFLSMKEQQSQKSKIEEEIKVSGEKVVEKAKEIVHESNVRRLIIKSEEGRVLLNVPIVIAGAGVIMAPWLAVLAVVAALVTNCTIVVKRKNK